MSASAPWRPAGVSVYVHVPYCASKCAYCDFTSTPGELSANEACEFVDGVSDDLRRFAPILDCVPTIYVGGGTPTLLRAELPRLVHALRALPGSSQRNEVTAEANPDSLDDRLVVALADAGVTRISLGVQSFDDEILSLLGRRHDARGAARGIALLAESGLRYSLDLICGVPGLDDARWRDTLDTAIRSGAGHVSVYPLAVEDGTPLAADIAGGALESPDPDVAADHVLLAHEVLSAAGLMRYEVASWAIPGQESRHNSRYWTGGSYIGVGPSAASMLTVAEFRHAGFDEALVGTADDDARVRFVMSDMRSSVEVLSLDEAAREDAMLGLRMAEGISEQLARAAGVERALAELREEGLVARSGSRWTTTAKGWLLGNEVFGRVWMAE